MKKLARSIYKEQVNRELKLYFKLSKKFKDDPLDINDARILSQAVYFKEKNIFEDRKMMIASTDHHFTKIRVDEKLNDFVSKSIYKQLGIYCDWPDEVLKILKGEKDFNKIFIEDVKE